MKRIPKNFVQGEPGPERRSPGLKQDGDADEAEQCDCSWWLLLKLLLKLLLHL